MNNKEIEDALNKLDDDECFKFIDRNIRCTVLSGKAYIMTDPDRGFWSEIHKADSKFLHDFFRELE